MAAGLTKDQRQAIKALVPQEIKDYCRDLREKPRKGNPMSHSLTPAAVEKFLELTAKGITIQSCCAYTGISKAWFYELKAKFPSLADAVTQAHAMHEVRLASELYEDPDLKPEVKLKILERRHPEGWSEKRDIRHSGSVEHTGLDVSKAHQLAGYRGNQDILEAEVIEPQQLESPDASSVENTQETRETERNEDEVQ